MSNLPAHHQQIVDLVRGRLHHNEDADERAIVETHLAQIEKGDRVYSPLLENELDILNDYLADESELELLRAAIEFHQTYCI